jgi:ADP-ribose pyrophosphatase
MKPLRIEVPFATPWFSVVGKTLRENEAPYYSLQLPDYAATVAVTSDQRVVLVKQYRPAVERVTLELPSGLIDQDEAPAATARRELAEETGYEAGSLEVLGAMLPDCGRLGNRIWCCVARDLLLHENATPEEGIEVVLYTVPELTLAISEGVFDHSLHVAAVYLAVLRGALPWNGARA